MYNENFKDLKQVRGIISLIPNEDILEAFIELNLKRLKPLFIPKAKVIRYEEGNFCSNCDYRFKGEENSFSYCVNCLEELACCDDPHCDRLNQRLEETIWDTLYNYHSFR